MRRAFENSFASKTVIAKLIELGYLNDGRTLTNKTVRVALERLQADLCRSATIQARIPRDAKVTGADNVSVPRFL